MKSVNILIETQSLRDFKAFIAINHIDTAKVFQIEKPILEEAELPFYFVTDRELYIKDLFSRCQNYQIWQLNFIK